MTSAKYSEQISQATARLKTKFVAAYYLLTIMTGIVILFVHGSLAFAIDVLAALFYFTATALLYDLSQPKPRGLHLLIALIEGLELGFRRVKIFTLAKAAHVTLLIVKGELASKTR